jgi:hypothetical protein
VHDTFPLMRSLALLLLSCLLSTAAEYKGKWTSSRSGDSGDIRMSLESGSVVVFTWQGGEVKAKVARSSSEGNAIEIAFHFTIDGDELESVFKGIRENGRLAGKYVTSVRADGTPVDGGSIEVNEAN